MSTKTARSSLENNNETGRAKRVKPSPKTNPVNEETQLSECFKKVSTSLYVSLSPLFVNNAVNGIKQQHLDPLVMTYYPKVKGVIIAYSNIRLMTQYDSEKQAYIAKVEGSSPFTFFWVHVDFLVWSPCIGDVLEGDIYMQTPSHIGLLICDVFNASIKKYNIPQDWEFKPVQQDEYTSGGEESDKKIGHWMDKDGNKIDNTKLKFTVKAVYTTSRVIHIEGTLIKPDEERLSQPFYNKESKPKASLGKHKKFDKEDGENELENEQENVIEIEEPKKDDILPSYLNDTDTNEDEDYKVVNNSDFVEDKVESD
ncbi:hypothetical protein KGF56_003990 [Candida oxycetoniae]|uniref:DNA-directed RNA polymerase subunit n=1 Tax=Candida oxycetoniae TaxID=497107 RepID=A0AAI9WWH3_9ASCO|nr:uncharacterized protein KGF56_003990 [Candida oxycetoniae]KAI3403220.1 hypothetical protein KGF56_003990 [Candida oxycetoniae]